MYVSILNLMTSGRSISLESERSLSLKRTNEMFFTWLAESDIDCLGSSQQNVGVLVALLHKIIHVTSLVVQLSPVSQEQLPTELERRESGEGGREGQIPSRLVIVTKPTLRWSVLLIRSLLSVLCQNSKREGYI